MEAEDAMLESAVLELNPSRTRCDMVIKFQEGDEEKIASWDFSEEQLIWFREQILQGDDSIRLELEPDEDSSWFTKRNLLSFLKFVNSPAVLERVCTVENELLQVELALSQKHASVGPPASSLNSTTVVHGFGVEAEVDTALKTDNTTSQVLEELEARRMMLEKEQDMAFAVANASGFTWESVAKLHHFACKFGSSKLESVCESYMNICSKKRGTEIIFDHSKPDELQSISSAAQLGRIRVDRSESKLPGASSPFSSKENDRVAANVGDISDRRLSVQEKISMFERTMGAGQDDVRRSIDVVDRLGSKPVLRRWSLVSENTLQRHGSNLKESEVATEDQFCPPGSEAAQPDLTAGEENAKTKMAESRASPAKVHTADAADIFPAASVSPLGMKLFGIAEARDDDEKSVSSDTQSLIGNKGRLYDQYREKRDAKLREEPGSKKAEKQARLKKMQETLERRRGEIARDASKTNPFVEAQVRAAKLRAFKAGLVQLKKEKEEEEKKRLEALRMQRQKLTAPTQSPHSPRSGASTPRQPVAGSKPSATSKGLLPTFRRTTSTAPTRNNNIQIPPFQNLPSKSQKIENLQAPTQVKKSADPAPTKLRRPTQVNAAAFRKSVSSLTEAKGLKLSTHLMSDAEDSSMIYGRRRSENFRLQCSSNKETTAESPSLKVAAVRARVTSEDEDVSDSFAADADFQVEEEQGDEEYKAPVAPVSQGA